MSPLQANSHVSIDGHEGAAKTRQNANEAGAAYTLAFPCAPSDSQHQTRKRGRIQIDGQQGPDGVTLDDADRIGRANGAGARSKYGGYARLAPENITF